jgi:hypothetical protein
MRTPYTHLYSAALVLVGVLVVRPGDTHARTCAHAYTHESDERWGGDVGTRGSKRACARTHTQGESDTHKRKRKGEREGMREEKGEGEGEGEGEREEEGMTKTKSSCRGEGGREVSRLVVVVVEGEVGAVSSGTVAGAECERERERVGGGREREIKVRDIERGREGGREGGRGRQRETEKDRETEKQRDRERDRERQRETEEERQREGERERERERERHAPSVHRQPVHVSYPVQQLLPHLGQRRRPALPHRYHLGLVIVRMVSVVSSDQAIVRLVSVVWFRSTRRR